MTTFSRRTYLAGLTTGSITCLAGCAGDSGDGSGGGNDRTNASSDGTDEETDDQPGNQSDGGGEDGGEAAESIEWTMPHRNDANNTALDTWGSTTDPSIEWQFETATDVNAAPIVTSDTVYVAAGDGYEGSVYAIDRSSGEQRWEYETGGVEHSSPLLHDGALYFGGRRFDEGAIPPVEYDGMLYAIEADTGTERWLLEDVASDIVNTAPAIRDGTVFCGTDNGMLYAVDAESGELAWELYLGGEVNGSPAIVEDRLFVGTADNSGDALYAIDLEAERLLWQMEADDFIEDAPVIYEDTIYVADYGQTYAVSAADGEVEWSYAFDSVSVVPPTNSTAAVRDGTVYLTSGGAMAAVDAESGDELWGEGVSDAGSAIPGGPVVAGNQVYAADGTLFALATDDGEELWTFDEEHVSTEPVVVDGTIYIGGNDGVYALSE